jgi:hypothetical protein
MDLSFCDRDVLLDALVRAGGLDSGRACSTELMQLICDALEHFNCAVRDLYLVRISNQHAEMLSRALTVNLSLRCVIVDGSHEINWVASSVVVSVLGVYYSDDTYNAGTDWERIARMPSLRQVQFRARDDAAMDTFRRVWPTRIESENDVLGWTVFTRVNQTA